MAETRVTAENPQRSKQRFRQVTKKERQFNESNRHNRDCQTQSRCQSDKVISKQIEIKRVEAKIKKESCGGRNCILVKARKDGINFDL